jgi:hypothetical protein
VDLASGFAFRPTTPLVGWAPPPPSPPRPTPAPPSPPAPAPGFGLLTGLIGTWSGAGFNTIWRPFQRSQGSDHFLEINVTQDTLEFTEIPGQIPNRGLLQPDLLMVGLRYLQSISDANVIQDGQKAGLHIEPGLWLSVPATTDPNVPPTVVRMASIPHGTTIVAQGLASTLAGAPTFPPISITPFQTNGGTLVPFAEQTLTTASQFRTTGAGLSGVTQAMLDNPNSVLAAAAAAHVTETIVLNVSSEAATPVLGGGTANTAFLQGGSDGPNADAARVSSTFWLQTTVGASEPDLLQYSQMVLLNFNGLSWPHVTVGTLKKQAAPAP